jgi:hypothetical protein
MNNLSHVKPNWKVVKKKQKFIMLQTFDFGLEVVEQPPFFPLESMAFALILPSDFALKKWMIVSINFTRSLTIRSFETCKSQ